MQSKRPINLNLTTIRFPITAIVSILHRISGIFIFLLLPALLWVLGASLKSAIQFQQVRQALSLPISKFVFWVLLSAIFYHLVAGVRHLIMDFGYGEGRKSGALGARTVLILSVIGALILGIWLW